MGRSLSKFVLWLYVINLGVAFGAALYETKIVIPEWMGSPPDSVFKWNDEEARHRNAGVDFWAYVTTGPLTFLTIASLIFARLVRKPVQNWWFAAAIIIFFERLLTFSYFNPTALKLMRPANFAAME